MQLLVLLGLTVTCFPAHAYIGPGIGAGTIAVVLGVLGAIVLAVFSILYYPIKRLLKNRKSTPSAGNDQS